MHGPKSWNQTAEKNSKAERLIGLNSQSYNYLQLFNPLFWYHLLFRVNVLHFYTGYFLLPLSQNHHLLYSRLAGLELRLLKFLGKKIVLHFQGCEIRDRFHPFAQSVCPHCKIKEQFCSLRRSARRRARLLKLCKLADAVAYSTPDLGDYLNSEKSFLIPKVMNDIELHEPISSTINARKLRIIHAPTDRSIKGTGPILKAVARHEDKFELLLAENLSREQVHALAQTADLAIDQIRVGWYGNFAVEMMALNLPVVAYIRPGLEDAVYPLQIPIINASEHNLEEVLLQIWENRNQLHEIGIKSRTFAEAFHSEAAVAEMLLKIYNSFS